MLCERMLAEGNGEALGVIFLEVLQRRPKDKARQTFEITEFFEFNTSVCGATPVRRFGSWFAERGLRWRRRRLAKMKEERASADGDEKCNEDDRER